MWKRFVRSMTVFPASHLQEAGLTTKCRTRALITFKRFPFKGPLSLYIYEG
jgi:hypothetical protein